VNEHTKRNLAKLKKPLSHYQQKGKEEKLYIRNLTPIQMEIKKRKKSKKSPCKKN